MPKIPGALLPPDPLPSEVLRRHWVAKEAFEQLKTLYIQRRQANDAELEAIGARDKIERESEAASLRRLMQELG